MQHDGLKPGQTSETPVPWASSSLKHPLSMVHLRGATVIHSSPTLVLLPPRGQLVSV
jgi:hypothetical protein